MYELSRSEERIKKRSTVEEVYNAIVCRTPLSNAGQEIRRLYSERKEYKSKGDINMTGPRISREKNSINKMIGIYCKANHGSDDMLCEDCRALLEYAWHRLDRCSYGEEKPKCSACPIHCYQTDMREKVIVVMRYSGPRMIYKEPLEALRHLLNK